MVVDRDGYKVGFVFMEIFSFEECSIFMYWDDVVDLYFELFEVNEGYIVNVKMLFVFGMVFVKSLLCEVVLKVVYIVKKYDVKVVFEFDYCLYIW